MHSPTRTIFHSASLSDPGHFTRLITVARLSCFVLNRDHCRRSRVALYPTSNRRTSAAVRFDRNSETSSSASLRNMLRLLPYYPRDIILLGKGNVEESLVSLAAQGYPQLLKMVSTRHFREPQAHLKEMKGETAEIDGQRTCQDGLFHL